LKIQNFSSTSARKVKVKIIEIKDGKISLSIKALKENPWKEAEKKYKKDDVVEGVIINSTNMVHLHLLKKELQDLFIFQSSVQIKTSRKLELGKSYKFKITMFDAKEQKMTLSFVESK
jgi:small subunit ribosomal protein S1